MNRNLVYDLDQNFNGQSLETIQFLIEKRNSTEWKYEIEGDLKRPWKKEAFVGLHWKKGILSGFGLMMTYEVKYKSEIGSKNMLSIESENLKIDRT